MNEIDLKIRQDGAERLHITCRCDSDIIKLAKLLPKAVIRNRVITTPPDFEIVNAIQAILPYGMTAFCQVWYDKQAEATRETRLYIVHETEQKKLLFPANDDTLIICPYWKKEFWKDYNCIAYTDNFCVGNEYKKIVIDNAEFILSFLGKEWINFKQRFRDPSKIVFICNYVSLPLSHRLAGIIDPYRFSNEHFFSSFYRVRAIDALSPYIMEINSKDDFFYPVEFDGYHFEDRRREYKKRSLSWKNIYVSNSKPLTGEVIYTRKNKLIYDIYNSYIDIVLVCENHNNINYYNSLGYNCELYTEKKKHDYYILIDCLPEGEVLQGRVFYVYEKDTFQELYLSNMVS